VSELSGRFGGETGRLVKMNQITELPEAKAEVIEVRQYGSHLPLLSSKNKLSTSPAGLEMDRSFGSRLESDSGVLSARTAYELPRTQKALLNLHGVEISQGGIDQIMQRAGAYAIQKNRIDPGRSAA